MNKPDRHHEMMFMGFGNVEPPAYPRYLYRDGEAPRLIADVDEEKQAREDGWDNMTAAAMANRSLINWYWDLEDFSPKQLRVFAKDEYGIDFHNDADQETLFAAVCELVRHAPQNRHQLVLMAHTIEMEYDATMEEIRRAVANPDASWTVETIKTEIWA